MRKLRLAAAVGLVLASSGAFALGLGDIEMRSALNQPMNAEIRLTSVKPGELDGMIVKLASPEAFARAGIDRSQSLQDLRFSVDQSGANPVIRITSSGPVVEPFLNFLLEVDWPQGRMVREYTVLLDPPVFLAPSTASSGAVNDTPAFTNRNDNALVAPAPIDRQTSNAAADDFAFDVEVVGGAGETNNDLVAGDQSAGGAAISDQEILGEEIDLSEFSAPSAEFAPADAGEVVALTDLEAPNTDAQQARAAADFDFDVEVVGGTTEIASSQAGSQDVQAQDVQIQAQADVVGSEGEEISLESFATPSNESIADTAQAAASGERAVQSGDTLYEIAESLAPSGVTVQQMMLALLSANQSAFIDGNINLVRAGSILRIPDAAEARSLTQAQAVAEVASQNQLWQEYRDNVRNNQATQVATNTASTPEPVAAPEPVEVTEPVETASTDEADVLSADARAILEQARQEILQRDELRIVGEDSSASDAENVGDGTDGALSSIDSELQQAREDLSSSQLAVADLDDQASQLRGTSENLDALVSLRQNEIAALEQRLADARTNADNEASAAGEVIDEAADAAAGVIDGAENAVSDAASAGGDAVDAATTAATDAASNATNAATNAVTPAEGNQPWWKALLDDPRKLAVAGVGGLALFGVLATLLFRRRKSGSDDIEFDDADVQFVEGDGLDAAATAAVADKADKVVDESDSIVDKSADRLRAGGAAVAAAGAAGVAAVTSVGKDKEQPTEELASFEDTVALASEDADAESGDDTISEVEVYLAYGLHGQAEELLTGAIAQEPDNAIYARKLLDTYHAQGNGESFATAARDYHTKFGGAGAPGWAEISAMGHELRPQDDLFSGSADSVESVGAGGFDGDRLSADDFLSEGSESVASSVSREFGASDDSVDIGDLDESALMDQSIDPAFAFDETDLEATGDFTQISKDLADDGALDFPNFDDAAADASTSVKQAAGSAMDGIEAPELDGMGTAANEKISGAADSLSNDLTLDLDELTQGLSDDGTSLVDGAGLGSVDSLEIPDLTADNDLLSDVGAAGGDADEMDTMMDLAKAYIDMGDKDSATNALGEIVKGGSPDQVSEAETLLRKIS